MQAAHIVNKLIARTQMQVIGVGKLYLTIKVNKLSA
jgi:hypothetical protein